MKKIILLSLLVVSFSINSEEYFYKLSDFVENCGCKLINGYKPKCSGSNIKKLKAKNLKDALLEFEKETCIDGRRMFLEDCYCTKPNDNRNIKNDDIQNCRMKKVILIEKTSNNDNGTVIKECSR